MHLAQIYFWQIKNIVNLFLVSYNIRIMFRIYSAKKEGTV